MPSHTPAPLTRLRILRALRDHRPAPGKRTYLRDTTPGLVVELLPSGRASYQLYLRHDGRPRRVVLGRFDETLPDAMPLPPGSDPAALLLSRPACSLAMARALAAAARMALHQGVDPSAVRRDKAAAPSVKDLLDDYRGHLVAVARPESLAGFDVARKHLRSLDNIRAQQLTRDVVRRLHAQVGKQHPTMANRLLDQLRAALNLAHAGGRITLPDGNPAACVKRFPEPPRERWLTPAELVRVRAALPALPAADGTADAIALLLLTGVRKSALFALTHAAVDLAARTWTVPAAASKNGKSYVVPLVPAALAILRRRLAATSGTDHVFAFSDSGLSRAWAAVRTAAGCPDVTLHDLRRTFGANVASAGTSLHIVGRLLGHERTLSATHIYGRLSADALRAAAEAGTAGMSGPVAVRPRRSRV